MNSLKKITVEGKEHVHPNYYDELSNSTINKLLMKFDIPVVKIGKTVFYEKIYSDLVVITYTTKDKIIEEIIFNKLGEKQQELSIT